MVVGGSLDYDCPAVPVLNPVVVLVQVAVSADDNECSTGSGPMKEPCKYICVQYLLKQNQFHHYLFGFQCCGGASLINQLHFFLGATASI